MSRSHDQQSRDRLKVHTLVNNFAVSRQYTKYHSTDVGDPGPGGGRGYSVPEKVGVSINRIITLYMYTNLNRKHMCKEDF